MEPPAEQPVLNTPVESQADDFFSLFPLIWTQPREAIRRVIQRSPGYFALPLILIDGVITAYYRSTLKHSTDIGSFLGVILAAYFAGFLLRMFSKRMGGVAAYTQTVTAVAWSALPSMVGTLAATILLMMENTVAVDITGMVILVFSIWSLVVNVLCVAEVNRFSVGKAIAAVVLSFVIVLVLAGLATFLLLYVAVLMSE